MQISKSTIRRREHRDGLPECAPPVARANTAPKHPAGHRTDKVIDNAASQQYGPAYVTYQ